MALHRVRAAWRPAIRPFAVLLAIVSLATYMAAGQAPTPKAPDDPAPSAERPSVRPRLYGQTVAAQNPEQLTVLSDGTKLVGWISGAKDHAGDEVSVRTGANIDKVKVEPGNTFTWQHQLKKPTRVEVSFGSLKQRVTAAPDDRVQPCVFFVPDRHVYRPGQTVHFAGFLRQMNEQAEFVPLARTPVEVQLHSQRKATLMQSWKLTSDDSGRIDASYRFSDADPLDTYQLTVPEYKGTAQVTLSEYRKAKVQVRIGGERVEDKLKLRFQAFDFMDKPVPAQKVTFTIQIVRSAPPRSNGALKGEDFVHADRTQGINVRLEDLSEDEQLLLRADPDYDPEPAMIDPALAPPVAQGSGEINLAGTAAGEFTLTIPRACQQPGYAAVVNAVLTDASGREERKAQRIPLNSHSDKLRLSVARPAVDVEEEIAVQAGLADDKDLKGAGALVAMRLSPGQPYPMYYWNGFGQIGQFGALQIGNLSQFGQLGLGWQRTVPMGRWQNIDPPEAVKRTLATATVFQRSKATLKLSEPGAYKLVAIWTTPDGERMKQEVGVVVQPRDERKALTLELDRSNWTAGATLTGSIQSRFRDARVLLTIRDGTGLRRWKAITLKNGFAQINEPLPADVHYGCVVTAQYADGAGPEQIHLSSRTIHVEPAGRELKVDVKTKANYKPGEQVVLDVQVDRQEEVDLVVSVFDQSLVNIKPGQAIDVRSFFLADERAFSKQALDLLQRRLRGVTVEDLLRLARRRLAEIKNDQAHPEFHQLYRLVNATGNEVFYVDHLVTLLNLAGVKGRVGSLQTWGYRPDRKGGKHRQLIDLLNAEFEGNRIHVSVLDDTFILSDYNVNQPSARYWPMPGGLAQLGGGGFGQIGGGGFGQIGQLGGQAQMGGIGWNPGAVPRGPGGLLGSDADQGDLYVRRVFIDSAFWNARLRTDVQGKARVDFKAPDSITAWQVHVTAVSNKTEVGQATTAFKVSKPIMVDPILPRVFTEGDVVKVLAYVVNRSEAQQTLRVRLKVDNGQVLDKPEAELTLEPGKIGFVSWKMKAGNPGVTQLLMTAECPAGSDGSLKRIPVVQAGVEEVVTKSGFAKDPVSIEIPKGVDPTTVNLEMRLAPTLAADLVDTLDYLVEYPYGCVEQTMSRFLPAIKVAGVLKQIKVDHPGLQQRLPAVVDAGIKRLLELQQPDGGWGWNGNGQTHEMMTPYALYGLLQAEKAGYRIGNDAAVNRGLDRLQLFIATMENFRSHASDCIYCMYVYGHRRDIDPTWWVFITNLAETDALSDQALALALELAVQKEHKAAGMLADRLRKRASQLGGRVWWKTAGFSRWADDPNEVTATALKALVAYDPTDKLIPGVLAYFAGGKRGNKWNSTKDTALIVSALCDLVARQNLNPADRPQIAFRCNGGPITRVALDNSALTRKVTIPAELLKAGENVITFTDGSPSVMYRLVLRHRVAARDIPARDSGIKVSREYWLLDAKGARLRRLKQDDAVPKGAYIQSVVQASQDGAQRLRYVLAENPRPTCCEFIPEDDRRFNQASTAHVLREERLPLIAWHHEEIPPQLENVCVLCAELEGEYLVPPARVELMYQTEVGGHSDSFRFKVVER